MDGSFKNKCSLLNIIFSLLFSFGNILTVLGENFNLKVDHYTTEEGLAQNYVDCIYRDSRGFIWIGTWYGLNRFDGYSFITYRPTPEKNSISDGFINAIVEDKNGDLWIATRDGINKFVFETEEFIHFRSDTNQKDNHISDNWINTLLFDDDNNLWIGTLSAGVEKITFDKDLLNIASIQRFKINLTAPNSLTNENIYCLLKAHDGNIYAGSYKGLDKINPQTGKILKYTNPDNPFHIEPTIIHSLFEDSRKVLWIGTESGLISIDHEKMESTKYPIDRASAPGTNIKALSHGLVKAISEDKSGKILVGTLGGLHVLDRQTKEIYLFPDNKEKNYSLNNKFINDIFCDDNGNIWIGTEKGGLNKFNINQKQFFFVVHDRNDPNSLSHNIVNSICEDDKYLWIGTAGGGLNRINKSNNRIKYYKHVPNKSSSLSLDFVSSIACNQENNELWLATWGCGLNHAYYSESTDDILFKTYRYHPVEPDGPPFSYISSVIFDNNGNLWIGKPDGLEVYDSKAKEFYTVSAGSNYGSIIKGVGCLFIDKSNNLWIGTTSGLRMIKLNDNKNARQLSCPDSVFTYKHNPEDNTSISGNFVVTILQDKTGSMWFSIYGKGLSKLEKLSENDRTAFFSHFTTDNGLSNSVVYGILEDNNNNLWLSTDKGLTQYNYIDSVTSTYFESDGLQSNQFYWSAFHKSEDGIMYFGSTNGLIYFNPDSIKKNEYIPNIVITDFKIFNQSQYVHGHKTPKLIKTISETNEIELHYNENIISFEFSALSYFSPEKNMYKYKMEGFDNDWTITSAKRRYVTYTNLNPGTYTFHVLGSNNDGVWNETGTSIKLTINPPWWKTLWFKLLIMIFSNTIIFILYKIRIRGLERKRNELEKLVNDRTKELKIKSEKLIKQTEELNKSNKSLVTINKTKDKLFTIIAHDLKNPFNAILGMLELIMLRYNKYDDLKKKEMLAYVNLSSQNLYKLLENLLDWARAQTGNIEYNPKPFALLELIKNNIELLQGQAIEKNIKFNCLCNKKIIVYADINLTNTVIRNLLSNAIKFTQNGTITISSEIVLSDSGNLAEVKIKDTGIGIEPDRLKNLFNINTVKSTTGTAGESGTGLGLVLCREFIEKNGGEIYVESEYEKGTTFIFTLPLAIK